MLRQLERFADLSATALADDAPRLYDGLFERSAAMRALEPIVRRAAVHDGPVLVEGETGSGKGLVAEVLHVLSERARAPWVSLTCGGLPGERLDAELFGEELPAPGGGVVEFAGRIDAADGGTLFLDEVADLPLPVQARLVQVIDRRLFLRNGGRKPRTTAVRVVASTHRDLQVLVAAGVFRADLCDRLTTTRVRVPPLRERIEEIPALVEHFRIGFGRELGCDRPPLSGSTLDALRMYAWPGNVRELSNLVKRYVVLGEERYIREELDARTRRKPAAPAGPVLGESLLSIGRRAARAAERATIQQVLERVGGNRAEAARRLRVSYKTLLAKLKSRDA